MTILPTLTAVITQSKTLVNSLSLRAVKEGRQVPIQTVLADAGFVPGDIVVIVMKEEYDKLRDFYYGE